MRRPATRVPTPLESEAAHLRAFELFRHDFLQRHPGGFAFHDLAHLGATTFAPDAPGGVHLRGAPRLNRVLDALRDFRRHSRRSDFRKPDGLGIARDGSAGELIEVTTVLNRDSAQQQLRDKLDTLTRTVNRVHALVTRWSASSWRPRGAVEMYYRLTPTPVVVSFEPTYREGAPDGVILYEVLDFEPREAPRAFKLPDRVAETVRRRQEAAPVSRAGAKGWADELGASSPALLAALRGAALVGGAALTVAAVVAALDPVPGDEVVAYAAASALVTFALRGTLSSAYAAGQPSSAAAPL